MLKSRKDEGKRKPYGGLWVVFFISACMFAIGVLVGRGNAPVEFDMQALKNEIEALTAREQRTQSVRSNVELGFYEALKKPIKILPSHHPIQATNKPSSLPSADGDKGVMRSASKSRHKKSEPEKARHKKDSHDKAFTIQVSSLKDRALAKRAKKALIAAGYNNAYVFTTRVPGKGVWHRIRLGTFANQQEAEPVMKKLKSEGRQPLLVAK